MYNFNFLAFADLIVSTSIATIILANIGRQVACSSIEGLAYKAIGLASATIAFKRFYIMFNPEVTFDVYGFILRVAILIWLSANLYSTFTRGVSYMWSRRERRPV